MKTKEHKESNGCEKILLLKIYPLQNQFLNNFEEVIAKKQFSSFSTFWNFCPNINFGHLMKLCTQVSDSKTRLSRAVVETVTNGGIKGFMAGLAPRWGFIISMVFRIDIKHWYVFIYKESNLQTGEENCDGCASLDCLRNDAFCHGFEKLAVNTCPLVRCEENISNTSYALPPMHF